MPKAVAERAGLPARLRAHRGRARGGDRGAGAAFRGAPAPDVTEENIQSRLRGLLLMALSNKFGEMLLTTGNKSEVAVGYATIYGDMAGGYNPIKDLYKTRVFETCRWRNANHRDWMKGPAGEVIPPRSSTSRPRRNCAPTRRTRTACRPIPRKCSTRSSRC
jgi:NAD+ synthase